MRNVWNLLLTLALFPLGNACQFFHDPAPLQEGRNGHFPGSRPGDAADPAVLRDTCLYVTGLRYPGGTDWLRNPYAEGTELVLFRDAEEVLSLPVGPERGISPDPDMHRVWEGHLYCDYANERETRLSRDGEELFRYDGRESLKGFYLRDGDIYTLGQSREGNTWSFRRNGELLAQGEGLLFQDTDSHAYPGGALQWDAGSWVFYFHLPLRSEGGFKTGTYHVYREGEIHEIPLPPGTQRVFDIRSREGKDILCYQGDSAPMLQIGQDRYQPGLSYGQVLWARIYPLDGGDLRIGGSVRYYDEWNYAVLWSREGRVRQESTAVRVNEYCFEKDRSAYVTSLYEGYATGLHLSWQKDTISLPKDSRFFGRRCAQLHGGKLYLALSATPGRESSSGVMRDGVFSAYALEGPLTGLWREP